MLLSLALRLYRIDYQTVWYDEALSVAISRGPIDQLPGQLMLLDAHPPLHYYILHFWFRLFGFGVWQARTLWAVFGTLAIVLTGKLIRLPASLRWREFASVIMVARDRRDVWWATPS